MKSHIVPAAAAVALLWTGGAAGAQKAINWAKSYDAAMEQSRRSGKLIMVDFYADW